MGWRIERVIAGVLVLCMAVVGTGLAFELRKLSEPAVPEGPGNVAIPHPAPNGTDASAPKLEPASEAQCAFTGGGDLAPIEDEGSSPRDQIAAIARRDEQIRELEFDHDVTPVFQDGEEMAAELTERFQKAYGDRRADEDDRLLTALGAIPPGTDLQQVVAEGLGGDVLGYYVPKTQKLLVMKSGDDDSLGGAEKFILSHELEHALADQNLGLPRGGNSDPEQADASAARQALIEGDATITMLQYATTSLTEEERLSLATDPALTGGSSLDDAPYFVRKTFEFPYDAGAKFVCALYLYGGWAAVDRAYRNPPVSSAQVLFPQRYLDGDEPENPRDPKAPAPTWRTRPTQSVGAADLLWLLQAPNGDEGHALDDAEERAAALGGGEAHLFTRGADSAVALDLTERKGADVLCDSIEAWYRVSFPAERTFKRSAGERFALASARQSAVLRCVGRQVRLGIAPNLPAARAVAR